MKRVVYVAGPYRADTAWEIEQNIRRAEEAALSLWGLGVVALCPHAMTRYYQGTLPDSVWLEGDLELLRRCDAIYLLAGWDGSEGARAEQQEAVRLLMPQFTQGDTASDVRLSGWLAEPYGPPSRRYEYYPRGKDARSGAVGGRVQPSEGSGKG